MSNNTVLEETILMYCSVKGLENVKVAFSKLESALPTLRGRKFYGYYNPETQEYRACVAVTKDDKDPASLGFQTWKVPRGDYVYGKIMDWQSKISTIGPTVDRLIKENESKIDWSRPILEYYRAVNELRLMIPVSGQTRGP